MASRAQQQANRANAQRGTGPRTADGKARSKRNATKHGILSGETLIAAGEAKEDAEALEALREDLRADLRPFGALQEILVDKLVVTVWRWRRVLRYETGTTRECADEATADWARHQAEMQLKKDLIAAELFNGVTRNRLLPEYRWEETDDLELDARIAQDSVAALAPDDPLAKPDVRLAWTLYKAATERGCDVRKLLGLADDEDEAWAVEHASPEQIERLFKGVRHRGESAGDGWTRLRRWAEMRKEVAEQDLAYRRRQEERLAMQSILPVSALNNIMRYEAHLSREFARTLSQLSERQQ